MNGSTPVWRRRTFWLLAACAALASATYSETVLAGLSRVPWALSFCLALLMWVALLPWRLAALSLPLSIMLLGVFYAINEWKISAVLLPITFDDLVLAVRNPSVVLNAAGVWNGARGLALVAILAGLIVATRFARPGARESARLSWTPPLGRLLAACGSAGLAIVLVAATAWISLGHYGAFAYAHVASDRAGTWRESWSPNGQATLSRELGALEYIAFSFAASRASTAPVASDTPAPEQDTARLAASRFVREPGGASDRLPNIVFFHAESSFDPNQAFNLATPVSLPIWSRQAETRMLAPLRVNVVGGGSWVTEFEVLTGLDSRVFGYQGFYTHYYIAPRVQYSFARYLAEKGYQTRAFYPIDERAYNSGLAFRAYGFNDFVDANDLELPSAWTDLLDRDIVASAIAHGAFDGDGPFFSFLSTTENHGPHHCLQSWSSDQFVTTFLDTATYRDNCELNEYLRRARSTSDAVVQVLRDLKAIERRTGRPYVLLIYGDHQPWSFTGGIYSVAGGTAADSNVSDLSRLRKDADLYETFFHVLSSDATVLTAALTKPLPVAFLPTVVSAYVANGVDDLYLAANLVALERCEADPEAATCDQYARTASLWSTPLITGDTTERHAPPSVSPSSLRGTDAGSPR